MLELNDVWVHYGGVTALKGVSLIAEPGRVTALIGSNGAGKSTCLRAISGLVEISSGSITYNGKTLNGTRPDKIVKLGIGHVLENKRLFAEMTVYDNLMTGAHVRRDKQAVESDLEKVYEIFPVLERASTRFPSQLSGGEQQMLAIGRGLMASPQLLLLDEPSLGLSPAFVLEVGEVINHVAKQRGVSVLLIEQNANLALKLADHGYVIETGRIALEGTSQELLGSEHVRVAYLGL